MEGISERRLGIVACFGIASFTSIFFFRLSVRESSWSFPECLFFLFFLSFLLFHASCTRLLSVDDSIDALADTSVDSVFI